MKVTQFYETTVIDIKSGKEVKFVILPRRAFQNEALLPSCQSSEDKYDEFQKFGKLVEYLTDSFPSYFGLTQLPTLIAQCLYIEDDETIVDIETRDVIDIDIQDINDLIPFAELVIFSPVVPFEYSPLALDSIGSVITKASGVGLGAYAGFTVAGNSPMLFITVPAGMIIFGAAAGVANALEQGLRLRLTKLIKGETRKSKNVKQA